MMHNTMKEETKMSSQTSNHQSQIPTPVRIASRNNSNLSLASISTNRGETNSSTSSKSQISKTTSNNSKTSLAQQQQAIDHKQIFATCGSSTPIRSFQRATISSVVKTRAFDNSPILQSLLAASSPSGQSSVSNSQTPSPHSTPVFSRSRSLRMSGGPSRYQRNSPSQFYRTSTRTPDIYSFNSGDTSYSACSQNEAAPVRLAELTNEKIELKESLEFLECERQVLLDTTHELKETLHNERSQWKKELEDLKKQITECTATRIKAETQVVQKDLEINELRSIIMRLNDELIGKEKELTSMKKNINKLESEERKNKEMNGELMSMMAEKLKYNGMQGDDKSQNSKCVSIVSEMAKLRLEVNEKDRLLQQYTKKGSSNDDNEETDNNDYMILSSSSSQRIDILNKFLDETVECIKGWPEDLANSTHVQDLMKTLLKAYR